MIEYLNSQQLKSLTIFLVGEACDDVYVYGTCKRISPEAPVPILKALLNSVPNDGEVKLRVIEFTPIIGFEYVPYDTLYKDLVLIQGDHFSQSIWR